MTTAHATIAALRQLADDLEALDRVSPLPDLYLPLAVQVTQASSSTESERIAQVCRINIVLGSESSLHVNGLFGGQGHVSMGAPFAYTDAADLRAVVQRVARVGRRPGDAQVTA